MGIKDSVDRYLDLYERLSDSANNKQAMEVTAQMNAAYNYQLQEKENKELKMTNIRIGIVFLIITTFAAFAIIFFVYRSKKAKERLSQAQEKLVQMKELSIQEKRIKQQQEEKLVELENRCQRIQDKLDEVLREKESLEALQNNQTIQLVNSKTYHTILKYLKNKKPISDTEWKRMEQEFDAIKPHFKATLDSVYKMTEQEYHISILLAMKLKNSEISILLGRSACAISLTRRRLYLKFFGQEGTGCKFDDFIKSL